MFRKDWNAKWTLFLREFGRENLTLCSGTFSLFEFHTFCTYITEYNLQTYFFISHVIIELEITLSTSQTEKETNYNAQAICQLLKLPISKIYLKNGNQSYSQARK